MDSKESVLGFLERVDCLKISRGITDAELFSSSVDLFSGQAFNWYLINRCKFQNWEQLVTKLKSDFLPYNYQDDLLEEIKARKQGQHEKVTLYINAMCGLFNRLDDKPSEKNMIRIIRKNLLPNYAQPLALIDIDTVDILTEKCKRLEETLSWDQQFTSNRKNGQYLLEPDLSIPSTSFKDNSCCKSSRKNISVVSSTWSCWNCQQTGHKYSNCRIPRKVFCFGCGTPDMVKTKCPKCTKNVEGGGTASHSTTVAQKPGTSGKSNTKPKTKSQRKPDESKN